MMRPLSSKRRKAAALAYNGIGSPTVVAKAVDEDADLLVEAGRASNIPVLYDSDLVNKLDKVDVGQEVPEILFESVAVLLSWAFWLRGKTPEDAGESEGEINSETVA
jgi:flagellar biosynthesis protein